MRNKILKKLNSRCGASISFALVAFIVATMVSLVIVAAALSNAVKIKHERENEQAYLISQSIAGALMDQVISTVYEPTGGEDGKAATNRYVKVTSETDGINTTILAAAPTTGSTYQIISEPLKSTLEELCKSRYQSAGATVSGAKIPKTTEYKVKVTVSDVKGTAEAQLPDTLKNKMNGDTVKITCYMPEIESTGAYNNSNYYDLEYLIEVPTYGSRTYTCRLHFDAEVTGSVDALYVYWPSATLVKGDGSE